MILRFHSNEDMAIYRNSKKTTAVGMNGTIKINGQKVQDLGEQDQDQNSLYENDIYIYNVGVRLDIAKWTPQVVIWELKEPERTGLREAIASGKSCVIYIPDVTNAMFVFKIKSCRYLKYKSKERTKFKNKVKSERQMVNELDNVYYINNEFLMNPSARETLNFIKKSSLSSEN